MSLVNQTVVHSYLEKHSDKNIELLINYFDVSHGITPDLKKTNPIGSLYRVVFYSITELTIKMIKA